MKINKNEIWRRAKRAYPTTWKDFWVVHDPQQMFPSLGLTVQWPQRNPNSLRNIFSGDNITLLSLHNSLRAIVDHCGMQRERCGYIQKRRDLMVFIGKFSWIMVNQFPVIQLIIMNFVGARWETRWYRNPNCDLIWIYFSDNPWSWCEFTHLSFDVFAS